MVYYRNQKIVACRFPAQKYSFQIVQAKIKIRYLDVVKNIKIFFRQIKSFFIWSR